MVTETVVGNKKCRTHLCSVIENESHTKRATCWCTNATRSKPSERIFTLATIIDVIESLFWYTCCDSCLSKSVYNVRTLLWHCSKCNYSTMQEKLRYKISLRLQIKCEFVTATLFGSTADGLFGAPVESFVKCLEIVESTTSIEFSKELSRIMRQILIGRLYLFGFKQTSSIDHNSSFATRNIITYEETSVVAYQILPVFVNSKQPTLLDKVIEFVKTNFLSDTALNYLMSLRNQFVSTSSLSQDLYRHESILQSSVDNDHFSASSSFSLPSFSVHIDSNNSNKPIPQDGSQNSKATENSLQLENSPKGTNNTSILCESALAETSAVDFSEDNDSFWLKVNLTSSQNKYHTLPEMVPDTESLSQFLLGEKAGGHVHADITPKKYDGDDVSADLFDNSKRNISLPICTTENPPNNLKTHSNSPDISENPSISNAWFNRSNVHTVRKDILGQSDCESGDCDEVISQDLFAVSSGSSQRKTSTPVSGQYHASESLLSSQRDGLHKFVMKRRTQRQSVLNDMTPDLYATCSKSYGNSETSLSYKSPNILKNADESQTKYNDIISQDMF